MILSKIVHGQFIFLVDNLDFFKIVRGQFKLMVDNLKLSMDNFSTLKKIVVHKTAEDNCPCN